MHFFRAIIAIAISLPAVTPWPKVLSRQTVSNQITVDVTKKYQTVDGWGFCEAFQRSNSIHSLSASTRTKVLDLLFSPTKGLGMNILRNGIGSSENSTADHMGSILPGPWNLTTSVADFKPVYKWDGNDNSQVWLAQQAQSYGVNTFFASAWSAPGFMKTNGLDTNGGYLCGTTGASCKTGDWRQVYADYLVQYINYYAQEGITITHLGFLNEPDLT
jgi:O-glycosyl hydrolase